MKLKTWIAWLIAGSCFIIAAILDFIEKKHFSGRVYLILGGLDIIFSISNYKKDRNKSNKKI